MLLLWLVVVALATSPQLHHLLHRDADDVGHCCLITQIQKHHLTPASASAVLLAAPDHGFKSIHHPELQHPPTSDYRLYFGRAPPSVHPTTTIAG
jgi:hypothetical protein